MEDGAFRARLTTRGRRSGRPHTVWLTAVSHGGDFYFSRHEANSDWFLNALADPAVEVRVGGEVLRGRASRDVDPELLSAISALKYPGQSRAAERRVAIRVTAWDPGDA